ncbi:Y-family DNA polymerase [Metamycoplasma buccale]|uniref:Y-family DNA polymerase n=1 Tax=Metamycoplasma buccale TaxID=55602 RepID=UPI00398F1562
MTNKIIFHIDMDSFFVSCERLMNPKLKNKPLAIAKPHKRSIASSISYELKKLGFKPGDSFAIIKKQVPEIVFVKPHYELYTHFAHKVFNYLAKNYTENIEIYSIDECYIDMTSFMETYHSSPIVLAHEIQEKILKNIGLPCSIGISYTKFLAKMSTNMAKPYGILETKKDQIKDRFFDLKIDDVFGIGKSTAFKLHNIGIYKYKDLLQYKNFYALNQIFGKNYNDMISQMNGEIENDIVVEQELSKGISNTVTFMENDYSDKSIIYEYLYKIVENISSRAQLHNVESSNIAILIRKSNKNWISKQKKLAIPTNDFDLILKISKKLFDELWDEQMIRGIGVRVTDLNSIFLKKCEFDLFNDFNDNKIKRLIFTLNQEFGSNVLKTMKQLEMEQKAKTKNMKFLREDNWIEGTKIKI